MNQAIRVLFFIFNSPVTMPFNESTITVLKEHARRARYPDYQSYHAIRWTRCATAYYYHYYGPIHSSPPIATLPRVSRLSHCRCALHFIFVQSSLRQDPFDLFQDRLICAIVLFRERKAIAPQKFSSVVTTLARLLSPIFTWKYGKKKNSLLKEKASSLVTMASNPPLPKTKAKTYENARRKRQASHPEGEC